MAVRLLAPANELSSMLADPRAPVPENRGFFVCDSNTFAANHTELSELVDPLTGLAFPILPSEEALPVHDGRVANWHHTHHPNSHPLLESLGGRAVRGAQVQLIPKEKHNHGRGSYHAMKVGPRIHQEVGHQLGACIAAAAGFVQHVGMHVEDGKLWLYPFTDEQLHHWTMPARPESFQPWQAALFGKFYGIPSREESERRLAERNQMRANMYYRNVHYDYSALQKFINPLVMEQDLSNVNRRVRHRFLRRADETKGLELMAVAVAELARSTVVYNGQSLSAFYRTLYEAGRLNPVMPPRVEDLMKHKMGDIATRRTLVRVFHQHLERREAA